MRRRGCSRTQKEGWKRIQTRFHYIPTSPQVHHPPAFALISNPIQRGEGQPTFLDGVSGTASSVVPHGPMEDQVQRLTKTRKRRVPYRISQQKTPLSPTQKVQHPSPNPESSNSAASSNHPTLSKHEHPSLLLGHPHQELQFHLPDRIIRMTEILHDFGGKNDGRRGELGKHTHEHSLLHPLLPLTSLFRIPFKSSTSPNNP